MPQCRFVQRPMNIKKKTEKVNPIYDAKEDFGIRTASNVSGTSFPLLRKLEEYKDNKVTAEI
jgi:hypothetical protein